MSILNKIKALPIVREIVRLSKRYSFPGFRGVPIYNVADFIYQELQKENLTMRANAAAYNFFLSLFPTIIFFFTLLPLLPFTASYEEILENSMKEFLPEAAHHYLFDIVHGILGIKREGLLSVGFFLAVIFSSSGMLTLMDGFDKSYALTFKKRSWLRKRIISIVLTILLAALMMASLVLIILGGQILGSLFDYLELGRYTTLSFLILRWIVVIFLFYLVITTIYIYGPSLQRKISFINPGATLATVFSIVSSLLFAYFVNNFGRYNELYGSIGALIVLLIWMQINAFILIAGFELNASIAVNKDRIRAQKE